MKILRSSLLATWVAVAACGDDSTEDSPDAESPHEDSAGADGDTSGEVSEERHASFLASAWCRHELECECDDVDDEAACAQPFAQRLDRDRTFYGGMGLIFDPTCPPEIAREIELRGCLGYTPGDVGCASCALHYGTLARGAPCEPLGPRATPCVRGLDCLAVGGETEHTCQDPCEVLPRVVAIGETCGIDNRRCDMLNAFCKDGVCEAWPGVGERCDRGMCSYAGCDRTTETCIAAKPRGEACNDGTECETRNCQDGVCVSYCWPRPF